MKCRFILQHCRFYKIESFKVDYCKKNFRQKTKGMKWISWEIWHFAGREIVKEKPTQPLLFFTNQWVGKATLCCSILRMTEVIVKKKKKLQDDFIKSCLVIIFTICTIKRCLFCGTYWSQLLPNSKQEIKVGVKYGENLATTAQFLWSVCFRKFIDQTRNH